MGERSSVTAGPCVDAASSLPVLMKAVWLVMKKRDVQNYGRILQFLELTHKQVPGLLCYMHHAKLSIGLKGKIVLHMVEEKKPLLDILTELNCHFPSVFADDSAAAQRNAVKVRQCKIHFRKLVLRMIRDERFRKNYVQNMLHLEYGDNYMAVLEKLLWEFLCRLQTVPNYQVPLTKMLPVVDQNHLSSTPIHPSSGLNLSDTSDVNNTEEMHEEKEKQINPKTQNVSSTNRPKENSRSIQGQFEEWQNPVRNKRDHGRCKGTGQSTSQGFAIKTVSGKTLDSVISPPDGGNGVNEPQLPYFSIFGFDCSESSKVISYENLSPPHPLQSQVPDLDWEHASDLHSRRRDVMGYRSFTDIQVMDVAQTLNRSPVSSQPKSFHDVSGGNHEGQGKAVAQALMSRMYHSRVQPVKLPVNINKNLHQELAQDKSRQMADSKLSQTETFPHSDSWSWVCSGPTDNDSNDPDYLPRSSCVLQQMNGSQPKRVLRFSSS
ncbi:TERF1-interacting nuclear factor 2 isoform X2 [Eleutherodactylus coqui]|uniref:TERF1-interacting nuclear factor 2 isoform X2 n=1 Tax=Eleutherodactylus coqui TaxID=57060 RepID=UPI0034626542